MPHPKNNYFFEGWLEDCELGQPNGGWMADYWAERMASTRVGVRAGQVAAKTKRTGQYGYELAQLNGCLVPNCWA